MAKTPLTNATSYLSPADFLKRKDARVIGDLVGDAGSRVSAAALLTDPNVLAALGDASGEVESMCLLGGRYTPADLAALTGNAQGFLSKLVAELAFCQLWTRRYPDKERADTCQWAQDTLERLADGEQMFGFQETADAGTVLSVVEDMDDVQTRNLVTSQAGRFFGRRSNDVEP